MTSDPQVLKHLVEISDRLGTLVVIGIVIAVAVVIRALLAFISQVRQYRREGIEDILASLYKQGRVDDLIQKCNERAASDTWDPYPHYYLGVVQFDRGNDAEARAHFNKVLALAPPWRITVNSYLESINERSAVKQDAGAH
ncbi:MAG: tetratricopeptide repeat protein [Steroidobacteraceae bacterium]